MSALDNLPWHALNTEHAAFAVCAGGACKYPADVAPFAGTAQNSTECFTQLRDLFAPGEEVYVLGEAPPAVPGLTFSQSIPGLQMIGSGLSRHSPSQADSLITQLSAEDADAMVQLTGIAFPGFFRPRTCEMGAYYGIRIDGQLIAMAGERMAIPQYREISGVCTHPSYTGKGYASGLIVKLMKQHAETGIRSFLHVKAESTRAIALYTRLGFTVRREIGFHRLLRSV